MIARVRSKHMAFAFGDRTVALSSCVTGPEQLVWLNLLLSGVWSRWAPEASSHQQFHNSVAHLSRTIFFPFKY